MSLSNQKHSFVRRAVRLLCQIPEKLSESERQEVSGWCGSARCIKQIPASSLCATKKQLI
ncbi:hypothetical protein BA724_13970 [Domibacillus iocasae]|uniref:Uncharacterized protein n=1 Tax=Domibacillus iocasae TaxID=1714016 RepID=A0A1E7DJW6_9BACI|nr:hypothetical protein BA724_13970 [Domibacillus iocasae]